MFGSSPPGAVCWLPSMFIDMIVNGVIAARRSLVRARCGGTAGREAMAARAIWAGVAWARNRLDGRSLRRRVTWWAGACAVEPVVARAEPVAEPVAERRVFTVCTPPSPSWPASSLPQQVNEPPTGIAHVCSQPAEVSCTGAVRPVTSVGVGSGFAEAGPPTCP